MGALQSSIISFVLTRNRNKKHVIMLPSSSSYSSSISILLRSSLRDNLSRRGRRVNEIVMHVVPQHAVRRVHMFSKQFVPIHHHTPQQAAMAQPSSPSSSNESSSSSGEIIRSHQLLVQAGFIRQSSSGIFHYLPFATRVMERIKRIIDQELQAVGCQKLTLPIMLDSTLWKRTGRWDSTGDELVRIKDRKGHDFCLAPTHEEAITSLVADNLTSHRQFPLRLYQIGTKFRDEMRPRYGLMRGKEFVMKDAYTFDRAKEDAYATYDQMTFAYRNIFNRMNLQHVVVEADSGNIGGSRSHEFQVLSDVGEDSVVYCSCGQYAANVEKGSGATSPDDRWEVGTMKTPLVNIVKSFSAYVSSFPDISRYINAYRICLENENEDDAPRYGYVVMGNGRTLNRLKLEQYIGQKRSLELEEQPINLKQLINDLSQEGVEPHQLLLDQSVAELFRFVQETLDQSANDTAEGAVLHLNDFNEVQQGDFCVKWADGGSYARCCQRSELSVKRGIEVAHVFYLGDKYSTTLGATFTDNDGEVKPIEMGCYGIGVSRVMQAIVETSNDKDGIIWPSSVTPFQACVIPMAVSKPKSMSEEEYANLKQSTYDTALQFAQRLEREVDGYRNEVMFDDRLQEHPPIKLKDASLLGYTFVIVFGRSFVKNGTVEVQVRRTGERLHMETSAVMEFIREHAMKDE